MKLKTKIIATILTTLAMSSGVSVANAAPAEAATIIRGMYVNTTYYGADGAYMRWLPARYYWVDYNWAEERFQGKRDCYCHFVPMI